MDKNTNQSIDYLTLEADHLRKNYENKINRISALERYSLLSTGVIWSWGATKDISSAFHIIVWLPAIITFLFGIRAWGTSLAMKNDIDYLIDIENHIDLPGEFGFGKFTKEKQDIRLKLSSYFFWATLQIITLIAPIYILKIFTQ